MSYVKGAGTVHLIACVQKPNLGIGKGNGLLYKFKEDLQHFKRYTSGTTVLMGRKTWESLGSKPLPNRRNVVLSSTYPGPGCEWVSCLSLMSGRSFIVIGGQRLYEYFAPHADQVVLSVVRGSKEADTFFPNKVLYHHLSLSSRTAYPDFKLEVYR